MEQAQAETLDSRDKQEEQKGSSGPQSAKVDQDLQRSVSLDDSTKQLFQLYMNGARKGRRCNILARDALIRSLYLRYIFKTPDLSEMLSLSRR
jgi:hypothetical protein